MRGRSIRLSILILVILGISVAALAFPEININLPGFPQLQRGGTGPLGLKLGLDLRGGAHLVYQADVGTHINATFSRPADEAGVNEVLEGQGLSPIDVQSGVANAVSIKTSLLDDLSRQQLRAALEEKFGAASAFEVTDTADPTPDQMVGVVDIITRRVNLFGTDEPIVQQFGDDRVIVQLPGASGSVTEVVFAQPVEPADLDSLLREQGFQDFVIDQDNERSYSIQTRSLSRTEQEQLRNTLATQLETIDSFQTTGGIEAAKSLIGETARLEFKERTCTDPVCSTFVDADIGLTGDDLIDAFASTSSITGEWTVNIQFNDRGSEIFGDLTRRIVGDNSKRIAVFLDDELLIAPVARAWIRDGRSQITGNFTREVAHTLAIQLESGRLPVPLRLIQESDVDALLGSASLEKTLIAGLLGLGLVMVFMIVYYRMAGVVAAAALVFYSVVVLATFKLIPVTLTLPHLGGFILSIGMAVDGNILIFERMKEEIRLGRTLASSMEVGFSRAWPAIRDGHVSTLITCGVLLWFGNRLGGGLINGFALSLAIGVIVSLFTAVTLSRNLLQVLAWTGLAGRINLFTPEGVQRGPQDQGRAQTVGGGR
jgi:preprotein translocase subunit SecD